MKRTLDLMAFFGFGGELDFNFGFGGERLKKVENPWPIPWYGIQIQ